MKRSIIIGVVGLALVGCATPARNAQAPARPQLHSSTETTNARIPAQAPVSTPDPFGANMDAPIVAAGDPAKHVEVPKDHAVSMRVKQRLAGDSSLRGGTLERVEISTVDGHVTLRGFVPSLADKVTIEQHAREAQGVVDVRNELKAIETLK